MQQVARMSEQSNDHASDHQRYNEKVIGYNTRNFSSTLHTIPLIADVEYKRMSKFESVHRKMPMF